MASTAFLAPLAFMALVPAARAQSSEYAVGADVSFLKAAEDGGKVFKDNGQPKPALEILAGIFWWEPAVADPLVSRGLFDANGNALPALRVFDKFTLH
ncbi:MAG: hypothetical protein WA871_00555 [Candidatus Acidiferrales bacterium]